MSVSWNIANAVAAALTATGQVTATACFEAEEKLEVLGVARAAVFASEITGEDQGRSLERTRVTVRVALRERPAEGEECTDAWMAVLVARLESLRDALRRCKLTLSDGRIACVLKVDAPMLWDPEHRRSLGQYTGVLELAVELVRDPAAEPAPT